MNATQQSALASIIATAVVEALGAHFDDEAPAKVTRPVTRKAPARKAPAKPAKAAKVTHLVKANRASFVKAHAWAEGLSTLDIAIAVTFGYADLAKGWAIGEGYTAKARTATRAAKRAVLVAVSA